MENQGKKVLGQQIEHDVTRVLMTADCVGGVWTYALDLAESLGDFGVEVLLATMGQRPSHAQAGQAACIAPPRDRDWGYY